MTDATLGRSAAELFRAAYQQVDTSDLPVERVLIQRARPGHYVGRVFMVGEEGYEGLAVSFEQDGETLS